MNAVSKGQARDATHPVNLLGHLLGATTGTTSLKPYFFNWVKRLNCIIIVPTFQSRQLVGIGRILTSIVGLPLSIHHRIYFSYRSETPSLQI
jgi:hypothetical protein